MSVAHSFTGDLAGKRLGGKGEGVAFNARIVRQLSRVPGLKIIVVVREPVEWLESLYNLRMLARCPIADLEGEKCQRVPSLEDVILHRAIFDDVRVQDTLFSRVLQPLHSKFPQRLLLLEFELLRLQPAEFFRRICEFLGIQDFPLNISFIEGGRTDRHDYALHPRKANLCLEKNQPLRDALRLLLEGEHRRLTELLAAFNPWVSSRLIMNRTHCE